MSKFIGRSAYLKALKRILKKSSASLVVIRGRRRIGKSRLAEEFSKSFSKAFIFSGLPPEEKITAAQQRHEFIRQAISQKIPTAGRDNWGDLFNDIANHTETGRTLIVLDEITWMGSKDPTFLGQLKIAWDLYFKKNPKLVLIISGSDTAWIDKNILSKTGFFGRISLRLTLDELKLNECAEFWQAHKNHVSAFEKLKVLAVTGGIPRYLEEIQPTLSAEENIYQLCFQKEGVLFNEFDDLFHDLFEKRSTAYKNLVESIASGNKTVDDIAQSLSRQKGGDLSLQLDTLCRNGLVSRDYTWNLKNGKPSKLSQYRLSDNYLRFYIKYIAQHRQKIENDQMKALPPAWESIMGIQFENLVIKNQEKLHSLLNIPYHEIISSNPYYQSQTASRMGCQIDYLIQTKYNTLYLCEIKFSKNPLGIHVENEVKEKIKRLEKPKAYSIRPVLIHVNGTSDAILSSDFFAHIIDFSDFFKV